MRVSDWSSDLCSSDLGVIDVNAQIISATHQNLDERIDEGLFREDLYYRLAVFPIQWPPLRERPEDVPALIQYFLRKLSTPETILNFTSSAMERLIHHEIGRAHV